VATAGALGALWLGGWLSERSWWIGLGALALAGLGRDLFALDVLGLGRRMSHGRGTADGEGGATPGGDVPAAGADAPTFEPLAEMLGASDVGVILTDAPGNVVRATEAARRLLDHHGEGPWAALHPAGAFFAASLEDTRHLDALHRFFGGGGTRGEGLATLAGSRRQISWAAHLLTGREGLGTGRLFFLRDITAEHRFESLKSDFLATISHELRTPLTSLRGSLQLVVARAQNLPAMDLQLLEIGIKNAERLIQVINDLLDIDSLEQDRMAFQFVTIEPRELLDAAVNKAATTLADREVRVEVDAPAALPTVHGDRDRLVQVLANLVGNAAKYSPMGGRVGLRARACDGGLQIDVRDDGPGIPLDEQPHVFERFWRSERLGADAGAGLGLAICRAVVARHGGRIWLESEPGSGAVFSIYLPRSLFRPEDIARDTGHDVPGTRILLIEADPDTRAVLQAALERHGYAITAVATGAQGVAQARQQPPAAVLLDLTLPDLGGEDVLRILKNSPETQALPVLVLSVDTDRERARRLGAWDVLRKPVDLEAVRWNLAQAVRRAGRPDGRLVMAFAPAVSRELAVLATALEQSGHRIHRAADLGELVEWTVSNFPDVLVVDDDFLPHSRSEAVERLRHPVTQQCIPLVFLTSEPDAGGAPAQWLELRKPISRDEFLDGVRSALASRS
jgi:signal transduction histidine kinase/DNA-binding response OmpR family regulator